MTPENDVNEESKVDGPEGAADAADDSSEAVSDSPEDSANTDQLDQQEATGQEQNDMDRAASAQAENLADGQSSAEETNADDPLGFGSKRMDAEVPEEGDELTALRTQLSESEARVASQQDQLLRIQAEMENQRKRAQNDVTKAHKFALEKIALDLLPVKDSLEMGLLAAKEEDAEPGKIVEGSELTVKMLSQALEKYNIVEVNPVGEKFDPEFHQAMSMQPVEGHEPNTVANVLQKGYTLNDRLIRPALVMVAK